MLAFVSPNERVSASDRMEIEERLLTEQPLGVREET